MSVLTGFIKSAVIPKSEEMTKAFIMKKEPRRALRVRRELYEAKNTQRRRRRENRKLSGSADGIL